MDMHATVTPGNRLKKNEDRYFADQPKPVFRKAMVAVTFSPRTKAVLNESFRLVNLAGAEPLILHIGEDNPVMRRKMEAAIEDSDFNPLRPDYLIYPGQTVEGVIAAAKKVRADLIIAGALIKEGLFKTSLSKVARQLAKDAPCSVLLLIDPLENPKPFTKVHCVVEYNRAARLAVEIALELSALAGSRDLFFTHSFQFPKELQGKNPLLTNANKIRKIYHQQDLKLHRFLSRFANPNIRYRAQCICEKTSSTTLAFAKELEANIFILPGPAKSEGLWSHLFTSNFERLLQNLPCSILLTRKAKRR